MLLCIKPTIPVFIKVFGDEVVFLTDLAIAIDIETGVRDPLVLPYHLQVAHGFASLHGSRSGPSLGHFCHARVKSAPLKLLRRIDQVSEDIELRRNVLVRIESNATQLFAASIGFKRSTGLAWPHRSGHLPRLRTFL